MDQPSEARKHVGVVKKFYFSNGLVKKAFKLSFRMIEVINTDSTNFNGAMIRIHGKEAVEMVTNRLYGSWVLTQVFNKDRKK